MTRDEIVTALRCCAKPGRDCEEDCQMNEISREPCREVLAPAAADLIENQQRHIEALMRANAALRDTVLRRDAQIEEMSEGLAQFAAALPECVACPDFVDKAQGDLEAFYGRAENA